MYQIQILDGIVEFQRQHIIGERHEEQRPLAHAGITKHPSFFQKLIGDYGTSRYPEDGKLVLNLAITSYSFDLI
jgi:hypothetical protein